jgi:hypothetical protein
MIIILGLVILVAAVVVGVGGILGNGGTHGLAQGFSVLGYHVHGSGTVFLYGMAVGVIALFGLWLLQYGARRTARRGSAARRGLRQSRRETTVSRQETADVAKARDELIGQRDTARAYTASAMASPTPGASPGLGPDDGRQLSPDDGRQLSPDDGRQLSRDGSRRSRLRLFDRRPAAGPRAAPSADPEPVTAQAAPGVPVSVPGPTEDSRKVSQP